MSFGKERDTGVRNKLDHNMDVDVSVSQITIRNLGGLLSAYSWSKDVVFLEKATKVKSDRLYKSSQSDELQIPYEHFSLKRKICI